MKQSKRYRNNLEKIKGVKAIDKAIDSFKDFKQAKFDESVEIHVKLSLDPSKSDQQIRTSVEFPNGTGKVLKIAVFAEGDKAKEAKTAGADFVFGASEIEEMGKTGKITFDVALATPQIMPQLARIAKVLGPKGLMPNPKAETVTENIKKAMNLLRKGKADLKNDNGGCIHQVIGKLSFGKKELIENYKVLMAAVEKQKPAKLKGKFIKNISISTTMGPGIKIG